MLYGPGSKHSTLRPMRLTRVSMPGLRQIGLRARGPQRIACARELARNRKRRFAANGPRPVCDELADAFVSGTGASKGEMDRSGGGIADPTSRARRVRCSPQDGDRRQRLPFSAVLAINQEGFVRVTAGRQGMAQHAQPQATFKPGGRATRPM